MHYAKMITIAAVAAALETASCNRPEPARETAREEPARADAAAAELQRKHNDEAAQLDKRVADLERRWTEHGQQGGAEVADTDGRIEGRGEGRREQRP